MEWLSRLDYELDRISDNGTWVVVAYGWRKRSDNGVDIGVMTCSIDNFPDVISFLQRETRHGYNFNFGVSVLWLKWKSSQPRSVV